ncbi:MAG TPA: MgtC/SapB family protein, partial [Bryobacteraceae bacterium]|nr:MgtC/SapB family protein [Bryobacteraceae bacterium]
MTAVPDWIEIARRLALTAGAGVLMGANRTARGRPAGLRTTCLVALAAAVAMIQADLLLATSGKGPNSFAVMDVERLPLGILS